MPPFRWLPTERGMAQPVKPPQLWTKEEVRKWITWCIDEYALDLHESQLDTFQMNGKALLMLKREDFCQRAPAIGDVIFNALQTLVLDYPVSRFSDDRFRGLSDAISGAELTSLPGYSGSMVCSQYGTRNNEYMTTIRCKKEPDNITEPKANHTLRLPLKKRRLKTSGSTINSEHDGEEESSSVQSSATSDLNCPSDEADLLTTDLRLTPELHDVNALDSNPTSGFGDVYASESSLLFDVKDPCLSNNPQASDVEDVASSDVKDKPPNDASSLLQGNEGTNAQNKLLWEFIAELLKETSRERPVRWLDHSTLTFRISDPAMLAEMWGKQKKKGNMTYEKLSRALRYYYKMKIISKVAGKKLTYRYITAPPNIIKGIRGAKPGVPHKRRKHSELPNAASPDPVILDLSLKKRKKSAVRCRKKKSPPKSASATVSTPAVPDTDDPPSATVPYPTELDIPEFDCLDLTTTNRRLRSDDAPPGGECWRAPEGVACNNNNDVKPSLRRDDPFEGNDPDGNDYSRAYRSFLL